MPLSSSDAITSLYWVWHAFVYRGNEDDDARPFAVIHNSSQERVIHNDSDPNQSIRDARPAILLIAIKVQYTSCLLRSFRIILGYSISIEDSWSDEYTFIDAEKRLGVFLIFHAILAGAFIDFSAGMMSSILDESFVVFTNIGRNSWAFEWFIHNDHCVTKMAKQRNRQWNWSNGRSPCSFPIDGKQWLLWWRRWRHLR